MQHHLPPELFVAELLGHVANTLCGGLRVLHVRGDPLLIIVPKAAYLFEGIVGGGILLLAPAHAAQGVHEAAAGSA